ncbi:aspartate aminotransferase [candidate division KSB1 bacterium 4484_87]|nr:MAG: aspartate aminotransferase [candidate division KSB1 bacterium 4484_87]
MVSQYISHAMEKSSWIRRMFEVGAELKRIHGPGNVFDLSLGNPIIEPPQKFFEVMEDISRQTKSGLHRYMPNAGFPEVREKIANHLTKKNILKTDGKHVIMSCGAGGGINVILRTLLDQGDEVIILAPFFSEYQFYVRNHHGKVVIAETDEHFNIDIEKLEKKMNKKTKAIIINNPNNPTGKVYDKETVQKFVDFMHEKQKKCKRPIYIISDEPYREIVYDDVEVPPICQMYENSFLVYSWSKSLAIPGDRIGYIAVNPEMEHAQKVVDGLIFCTRVLGFVNAPAIMQLAVGELLDTTVDIDFYERKKKLLFQRLTAAGYEIEEPKGTFYMFPKAPGGDDLAFTERAKDEKVLIVPGVGFGRGGHFRISYCTDDRTIENACDRLEKIV